MESGRAIAGADEGGLPASRIAVLYLDDRSRGSLGAVADAFTEDLIDELARVPELDVVSANGVRPFRDEDADAAAVARALGAGTIVLGSVGETRDGVGVDLALVDGASGAVFRRTSLEVPVAELLEGGTRLARESATLLRERLGEEVRLRETRLETNNIAAWSLLQEGRRAMKDAEGAIHDGRRRGFGPLRRGRLAARAGGPPGYQRGRDPWRSAPRSRIAAHGCRRS
jgi:TolB-like protein